jgi:DNA topoisomerase I
MQAENVEMLEGSCIKFDFLGKDSIRYENTVEVDPKVWENMKSFKKRDRNSKPKPGDANLFDAMNAQARTLPFPFAFT